MYRKLNHKKYGAKSPKLKFTRAPMQHLKRQFLFLFDLRRCLSRVRYMACGQPKHRVHRYMMARSWPARIKSTGKNWPRHHNCKYDALGPGQVRLNSNRRGNQWPRTGLTQTNLVWPITPQVIQWTYTRLLDQILPHGHPRQWTINLPHQQHHMRCHISKTKQFRRVNKRFRCHSSTPTPMPHQNRKPYHDC